MRDWKKAGTVSFGSGVRCTEAKKFGAKFTVYCEQSDMDAVEDAINMIESAEGESSVVDVFAETLRAVYAHLGLDLPDEFHPSVQIEALTGAIDKRQAELPKPKAKK